MAPAWCRKPLCKKILVVEGVYANTGDLAPLRALHSIKERYRWDGVRGTRLSAGVGAGVQQRALGQGMH
jgi:serine palmitoyltransferase